MKTYFYRQNSDYDKEAGNKKPLHINNAGYYFDIPKDITVSRRNGRKDFLLLYVSEGKMIVNKETLQSGDTYIFTPEAPQEYTYKALGKSKYYWIHFIGSEAFNLLSRYDIQNGIIKSNRSKEEKDTLFNIFMQEMKNCIEVPSDYATFIFASFLSLLGTQQKRRPFARAISELKKPDGASIAEIANWYNMSVEHFIRSFKEEYDTTPKDYRQNYRILQAMNLLESTNLSIEIIAQQCGVDDQFYFSRLFKKRSGMSPSKYRKEKQKT